jgi:tetratricopeptide (TPR) repeat protein
MTGHPLERARLLRDRHRFPEAVAAVKEFLAMQPDHFIGHYELAVTRLMAGEEHGEALADIDRAIGRAPEHAPAHAIRAAILLPLNRAAEALTAADRALELDPEFAFAWVCRGRALLQLRRLEVAEVAARKALGLDPDLSDASNLLSTVLRLQQRFSEAEVEIDRHLERDPENAWTFATAGWTALNRGQRDKAEQLFRESLRLEPGLEHARLGLREAFKARSALYRLHLKWVFFMERHSGRNQWLIILGIYVAFRFGRALLAAVHPLAAVPLVIAYLLFAFGGWLASGIGHFLMLKDPLARLTLKRTEKLDGALVGGLFFGGLLLLLLGVTVLPAGVALLGGAVMGAAVPGSLVCDNPSWKGRWLFGATTLFVIAMGALAAAGGGAGYVSAAVLAVALTSWIGGIPTLRRAAAR